MNRGVTDELVMDIVTEIAAREGVEPTELPPLARTVDPDALHELVDGSDGNEVTVTFTYHGYDVTVTTGGEVAIDGITTTIR